MSKNKIATILGLATLTYTNPYKDFFDRDLSVIRLRGKSKCQLNKKQKKGRSKSKRAKQARKKNR
ncbi:MAG: hypothetical protein C4K58_06845 [Flavobacteriaceae bacterium]|nr:MAG: hypothetical protein C4K58_06845 [Flavobacteriaceae bacterium]